VIRAREGEAPALDILPLAAAVAAAEALSESAGITIELRWPNDLFFAGRKLGGILCEASFAGAELEFAVVGIGVNVNQSTEDFPPPLSSRATSLAVIVGRALPPFELGVAIALSLEKWWERGNRPRILARWRELAPGIEGARVRVVPREGSDYEARIVGLADDGGLEVRLEDGTTKVLRSDDVYLQGDVESGYYEEVESYFVSRRGSPLFITPSEWDLVWRWEQLGIPLEVVKEGIDQVFDRPKALSRPRRLGYCRQTVEAAFRRFRESGVGARAGTADEEDGGGLTNIASRLRALSEEKPVLAPIFERDAEAIRALGERAGMTSGEIERELAAIDQNLIADAEAALDTSTRGALRREAETSLEPYRERMPEKVYRSALESAYRRRLRRKLGIPTLSLYA
jgi:biotin-(acetyl-CoA carboxylase) ligase